MFRMPAEWAAHQRCWMCWPCRVDGWGDAQAMRRAKQAYADIARAIAAFEPVTMVAKPEDAAEARAMLGDAATVAALAIDDSWARDSGPTFLIGDGLAAVQWRFNAWGGKYAPFADDALLATRIAQNLGAKLLPAPLFCEGGAIHSDGEGTLLVTEQTLCHPNRNLGMTQGEIERVLLRFTGSEKVLWLGAGFSDLETDGHIDNIACFIAPGRVLIGVPAYESHPDREPVQAAIARLRDARDARGRRLEIVEIEQPSKAREDWRGRPLNASYINFYIANGAVLMPGFDDPADEAALRALRDCFPGRAIVQIDARAIVEGGGGIHCITCQEPSLCGK